ncbi:MAG: prolipoprotein diacylglyceryl transferase [Acidobacteria bacterium]|nr:prolipoprotein diacylglyceryl transferase [Acidobacteriota bacterium]
MHPVLFHLGPVTIHTYGVLVATGVLLALFLCESRARVAGVPPDRVWNLGIYMVLAGILGSKLWLLIQDYDYYWKDPRRILETATLQAAGAYYGGLFAAVVVAVVYARRAHLKFLPLADIYSAPLALGHAVGRIGCFTAGCCWGKETALPWAVTFHDSYAANLVGVPLGVHMHPVQLYESALDFLLFGFLLWLTRRQKFAGQVFAAYIALYGVIRFATEFFRGDPDRTMLFNRSLSLMQVVSVGLLLVGAWIWKAGSKAKR